MFIVMENLIMSALTALSGALFGSFLGAYLKKKGENIALQEDIEKLVNQVQAVTEATKAIEAKISNEMWERQKRWEIKRDALFEAIKELGGVEHSMIALYSATLISNKAAEADSRRLLHDKTEAIKCWSQAFLGFQRATRLASIVCGQEVHQQFNSTESVLGTIASDLIAGSEESYNSLNSQLSKEILTLVTGIRSELGVNEVSRQ
jgi:hypothetical protein